MKYKISLESLGLSDVVKKGRTVREDLLKEIKGARGKVSEVNWKRELETFRSNPLDQSGSGLPVQGLRRLQACLQAMVA